MKIITEPRVSDHLTHHLLDQKLAERGLYDTRKCRRMEPGAGRKANYEAIRKMLMESGYGYKAAAREAARLARP